MVHLGDSLLTHLVKQAALGPMPPQHVFMEHPVYMAAWFGLFVTALNLMPLSQLDGGHIAYAVLGRRFRRAVWLFLSILVVLFLVSRWEGWLVWVVLAVAVGLKH